MGDCRTLPRISNHLTVLTNMRTPIWKYCLRLTPGFKNILAKHNHYKHQRLLFLPVNISTGKWFPAPAPILLQLLSDPVGKVSPHRPGNQPPLIAAPYHTFLNWHRVSIRQHFRENTSETFVTRSLFCKKNIPCKGKTYWKASVPSKARQMLGSHGGGTK